MAESTDPAALAAKVETLNKQLATAKKYRDHYEKQRNDLRVELEGARTQVGDLEERILKDLMRIGMARAQGV